MKRACPFDEFPRPEHPSLRSIPEQVQPKRKGDMLQCPGAKRFCTHSKQECLKRKSDSQAECAKRQRLEEAESRTNMLVDAYAHISHLEKIIRQLHIELQFLRQKTSHSQYISGVLAY